TIVASTPKSEEYSSSTNERSAMSQYHATYNMEPWIQEELAYDRPTQKIPLTDTRTSRVWRDLDFNGKVMELEKFDADIVQEVSSSFSGFESSVIQLINVFKQFSEESILCVPVQHFADNLDVLQAYRKGISNFFSFPAHPVCVVLQDPGTELRSGYNDSSSVNLDRWKNKTDA
ncbi:hypothetical protein Avbf_13529, partial [Armadillidium vulgare]